MNRKGRYMLGCLNKIAFSCFWLLVLSKFLYPQDDRLFFDNYTVNNGLSDNYIDCIYQDSKGWIWIGTRVGIERFDGLKFKQYNLFIDDTTQKEGLLIREFYEDKNNRLYACYEEQGLAYYNRELDRFESMKMIDSCFANNHTAKDVIQDAQGNLWVATKNGVLKYIPNSSKIKTYTDNGAKDKSLSDNYVRKLAIDKDDKIWIGTRDGLDHLDPESDIITQFSTKYNQLKDDILDIYIDDKNRKWIGTSNQGVILIDSNNYIIEIIVLNQEDLRSYKVSVIYQRTKDELWFGTRGGLYILNQHDQFIKHVVNNELDKNSLVHNSILNILEDDNRAIWIGTRGGMSYLTNEKQSFTHYKSVPGNNRYLNNGEIYCIWIDPERKVWLGTEKGGVNILNRETGRFDYLTKDTRNGISNNCIKTIFPLDNSNILIGTFQGGLNIYNRHTKKSTWLKHESGNSTSISSNIVWDIARDKNNRIWIATANGLDLFNPADLTFTHNKDFANNDPVSWIEVDNNNDLWLSLDVIKVLRPGSGIIQTIDIRARDVFIDSKNRYWIASEDRGIVLCDKYSGTIREYSESSGIASKLTYRIEEDISGKLWISTTNGLSCFDTEDETFINYTVRDGLQSNQFYYGASCKDSNGQLYFGGINGLTIFNPAEIIRNRYVPPIYITDFKIFNESVEISKNKDAILKKSISETKELHIPYSHNVITFEFAALNYTNSDKNQYKYKLEGFDEYWMSSDQNQSATYTNLHPGKYVFHVIGSNNNNIWNKEGTSLTVYVTPPVYMTIWFRLIFLFTILLATFVGVRIILLRRDLKRELELEKAKAKNLHELDLFKLKFFTNISHEIKTPLTLIISPLKKMLNHNINNPMIRENLLLMEKHSQNLMNLINQLLDFRKLQDGKLILELKKGDIVRFCKTIFESFHSLMEEKGISYNFGSVQAKINANFDPDKLKKILNNLISNAIRYNKKGGNISLLISMVIEKSEEQSLNQNRYVKIVVEDTGVGMEADVVSKIFKRYFNQPSFNEVNSSGIGLAFTKELIELHNGKIYVESKVGEGSSFTVMLPIIEIEEIEDSVDETEIETSSISYIQTKAFEEDQKTKKVILIIDDNKDIISFLSTQLKSEFLVLKAFDGFEGLEIATRAIPDIIIADIMMPKMDGIQLCEKIKSDTKTCHIPVILLSALTSEKNLIKGLESGADEYLTKPFDFQLLHQKIENLLVLTNRLKEKYSKQIMLMPSNTIVNSHDEVFLNNVLREIEQEIDNTHLDVDMLSDRLNISRIQLYRKISALTNMTVKELVSDIRLKRAAQIMSQHKLNVSEVVYLVGFNDLSYFGKCFKKKYGVTPTEYMKKYR